MNKLNGGGWQALILKIPTKTKRKEEKRLMTGTSCMIQCLFSPRWYTKLENGNKIKATWNPEVWRKKETEVSQVTLQLPWLRLEAWLGVQRVRS
jgi:hypothetical protein